MTASGSPLPPRRGIPVVAIGASGGRGMRDIEALLGGLPAGLPAIVMIVLHRPVDQVSHLCEVLSRRSALPVLVAGDGQELLPGHCYIGRPDAHLELTDGTIARLIEHSGNAYRNRTVDTLFDSVAAAAGSGRLIIGVVLSGSLDDGAKGLVAIHTAGGVTMVLTPDEPPQHGMPENAIGLQHHVDFIGTPGRIAAEIAARVPTRK